MTHQQVERIESARCRLRGFIQAGGRSSRMGRDKSWLEVEGQPLIERVMLAARTVVVDLSIIINAANPRIEEYQNLATDWNARLIDDLHDHRGPLGGIHTALTNCRADESALILACDLPFLTSEFLSFLSHIHYSENMQALIDHRPAVTLPEDQTGRLQPLAGIYSASCLPEVEQMLAQDVRRVDMLCHRAVTRRVIFQEVSDLAHAEKLFLNLNTFEDYSAIRD